MTPHGREAMSASSLFSGTSPVPPPASSFLMLAALRVRLLRNTLALAVRRRPLNLVGTAASLLLIWAGLYFVLRYTFWEVRRQVLEGAVAVPLIFTFFFLALTGMLAFSNAILCYGSLFRRGDSLYLMSSPVPPRDVVVIKYVESLLLSSWSLVLLGLPLMMALADTFAETWAFYPLFLGLFLLFIPVPGAIGLVLAWTMAMIAPKTPRRTLILFAGLFAAGLAWWLWRLLSAPVDSSVWLKNLYDRISLIQNAMLPHTWVSRGIYYALQRRPADALFYLMVTAANALFFSVIAVAVVSRYFASAFGRAQTSGARGIRRSGWFSSYLGEVIFFYLPWRQRLLAAKDIKTFLRDPLQWSQMAILFGLLALYVSNVQRLWTELNSDNLKSLIAFLNLTAVSLILATFTSRFVFPLISLEGQQIWLLGLLPLPRRGLIIGKFLYALTITLVAALAVMGVSIYRLGMPQSLGIAHLLASASICVGLCGVSIGMGARMAVFTERNPARIAGGFGGTLSLLISVGVVVLSLAGMFMLSHFTAGDDSLNRSTWLWLTGVIAFNLAIAAACLTIGIRHFNRLQF